MIGIAACILTALTGVIFGFTTRSMDEFAGYSMAASAFFGFSYTFHSKEHIRVSLLIQRFQGHRRWWLEIWCTLLGSLLAGFFAWHSVKMTVVSWQIHELSQSSMAIGTVVLSIALADRLVSLLREGSMPKGGVQDKDRAE